VTAELVIQGNSVLSGTFTVITADINQGTWTFVDPSTATICLLDETVGVITVRGDMIRESDSTVDEKLISFFFGSGLAPNADPTDLTNFPDGDWRIFGTENNDAVFDAQCTLSQTEFRSVGTITVTQSYV
jgi:hypothetical protein